MAEKKSGDLTMGRRASESEDLICVGMELMIGPDLINEKSFRRVQVNRDRIMQEGGLDYEVVYITVKAGLIVLIILDMTEGLVAVRMAGRQSVDRDLGRNAQREQDQQDGR